MPSTACIWPGVAESRNHPMVALEKWTALAPAVMLSASWAFSALLRITSLTPDHGEGDVVVAHVDRLVVLHDAAPVGDPAGQDANGRPVDAAAGLHGPRHGLDGGRPAALLAIGPATTVR